MGLQLMTSSCESSVKQESPSFIASLGRWLNRQAKMKRHVWEVDELTDSWPSWNFQVIMIKRWMSWLTAEQIEFSRSKRWMPHRTLAPGEFIIQSHRHFWKMIAMRPELMMEKFIYSCNQLVRCQSNVSSICHMHMLSHFLSPCISGKVGTGKTCHHFLL